jgi:hypothetical protein
MALTDADRLQMVAIAVMKHSVVTKTVSSGMSGFIYGIPEYKTEPFAAILNVLYGTPEIIE